MAGLFSALTTIKAGIIKNPQNLNFSAHFERKRQSIIMEAGSAKILSGALEKEKSVAQKPDTALVKVGLLFTDVCLTHVISQK